MGSFSWPLTQGQGVRQIARTLERDPGTISRELRRNCATRSGKQEYRATVAQWKAQVKSLEVV